MINAAAWSVWMLAFISFGYGKPIMRLSGVTVRISSAVRASGDHAYGLVAATAEKPAHSSDTRRWCSSTVSPLAARSAFSKIGYTCVGITSDAAISTSFVPGFSMPTDAGIGVVAGSCVVHSSHDLSLRASSRVYTASAPTTRATSRSPRWMAAAVSLTSSCGLLPPVVVFTVSRGEAPTSSATSSAGLGYGHDSSSTIRTESARRSRRSPVPLSSPARRAASAIMATGSAAFGGVEAAQGLADADDHR